MVLDGNYILIMPPSLIGCGIVKETTTDIFLFTVQPLAGLSTLADEFISSPFSVDIFMVLFIFITEVDDMLSTS